MKPIIAITTYGANENKINSDYYDRYVALPDLYITAVRRAGGIPILLPPGEENISQILDMVDGVIVSGGADVHPDNYGGNAKHSNLTRHDTARDALEFEIVKLMAERKDKPVLCVCRGMQVLNVALGGTMYEHIPDIRETDTHRNEDGHWQVHKVNVEADSKTALAMGATTVNTYSGHHQAVKKIADGLKIAAKSPDDIVEALELTSHPWMLGVQWHPEKSAHEDETQQALFDKLVEIAKVGISEMQKPGVI